jgi:hypothetical protein
MGRCTQLYPLALLNGEPLKCTPAESVCGAVLVYCQGRVGCLAEPLYPFQRFFAAVKRKGRSVGGGSATHQLKVVQPRDVVGMIMADQQVVEVPSLHTGFRRVAQ